MRLVRTPRFWAASLAGWLLLALVESASIHFDAVRNARPSELGPILIDRATADLVWFIVASIVFVAAERAMARGEAGRRLALRFVLLGPAIAPLYLSWWPIWSSFVHDDGWTKIPDAMARIPTATLLWDVFLYSMPLGERVRPALIGIDGSAKPVADRVTEHDDRAVGPAIVGDLDVRQEIEVLPRAGEAGADGLGDLIAVGDKRGLAADPVPRRGPGGTGQVDRHRELAQRREPDRHRVAEHLAAGGHDHRPATTKRQLLEGARIEIGRRRRRRPGNARVPDGQIAEAVRVAEPEPHMISADRGLDDHADRLILEPGQRAAGVKQARRDQRGPPGPDPFAVGRAARRCGRGAGLRVQPIGGGCARHAGRRPERHNGQRGGRERPTASSRSRWGQSARWCSAEDIQCHQSPLV